MPFKSMIVPFFISTNPKMYVKNDNVERITYSLYTLPTFIKSDATLPKASYYNRNIGCKSSFD